MKFQMYLFIFGLIGTYLHTVLCTPVTTDPPEEMKMMMGNDIMAIAPSLLRSAPGRNSRASWPGNIIPYQFEPGYPSYLQQLFRQAAQYIAKYTCIKFLPRNGQKDFVYVIQNGNECYSMEGRIGRGAQELSLPRSCGGPINFGLVVHEMLHTVGYPHEQNRFDRDDYVRILYGNIERGRERQFEKNNVPLKSKYDYQSVMHYPRKLFSSNGQETIVPRRRGIGQLGQYVGMTRADIKEINDDFCS